MRGNRFLIYYRLEFFGLPRKSQAEAPPPIDPQGIRSSDVFVRIAAQACGERITIAEILDGLGRRSFGLLLLVLAVPAWIPVLPPGGASIFGAAILLLSIQLLSGRSEPWLPDALRRRSFRRKAFEKMAERAGPRLRWLERYLRPRLHWAFTDAGRRLISGVILLLALALCVPLPMTNSGPALSIAVVALGLIQRDGLVVLAGIVLGILSIAVMALFWGGAYLGARWLIGI